MPIHHKSRKTVTAVILAGGSGRRMGGKDKGLMPFNGVPLIQHVLQRLSPQCDALLINISRNHESYAEFGYPLLEDSLPGGLGPLAGLLSALEHSRSDYVISVPCDTPFLPEDLVARMLEKLQRNGADVCTVNDGERLHPVVLLVKRSLQGNLRHFLEAGGRKVLDWYHSVAHCEADYSSQPEAFININTPEQLSAREKG